MDMNDMACTVKKKMQNGKTPMVTALGVIVGAAVAGVAVAAICNSKQVKTARMLKSAENIMYRVGTAMRDVSGMSGM